MSRNDISEGCDPRWEIAAANAEFGRAFASGDAKAVARLYTPAGKLFPPNAAIVSGRDAIEVFWRSAMEAGIAGVTLTTSEVESFDDTVIESGTATITDKGEAVVEHGKYLVVWKRNDGAWRLHRDCWNSNEPLNRAKS